MDETSNQRGAAVATPEQRTTAPIESGAVKSLDVEFVTVPGAVKLSSLGRTELYLAMREGRIRSISLRKPGRARGRRLVSVASLRQYLNSFAEQPA